jgi:hypothetical protein
MLRSPRRIPSCVLFLMLILVAIMPEGVFGWTAPYTIKIQGPAAADPYLNLAEVKAMVNGVHLNATSCTLSSTYPNAQASLCCNSITSDFCASNSDATAWFAAVIPSTFDTVIVHNRAGAPARIVGAKFYILDATSALLYSSTFASNLASYTFTGWSFTGTSPPSASPTVNSYALTGNAPYTFKIANPPSSDPFLNFAEVQAVYGGSTISGTWCNLSSV